MWPLGVSQQRSMRTMQLLQPKMKAIQERYKSDPQKMQQKMMEFYKEHKYILKANYADVTQSRNLICADVWSDMAASRANVHPRLVRTSNYGAVDGFPVSVWHNSEFLGLYTLNLHKDDDLFEEYK